MAGGSGFDVNPDVLGRGAQNVQSLVPQIQQRLRTLDTEMEQMFSTWQGQSSRAFQQLHATWQARYQTLSTNLGVIAEQLTSSQRTYLAVDESSAPRDTGI